VQPGHQDDPVLAGDLDQGLCCRAVGYGLGEVVQPFAHDGPVRRDAAFVADLRFDAPRCGIERAVSANGLLLKTDDVCTGLGGLRG